MRANTMNTTLVLAAGATALVAALAFSSPGHPSLATTASPPAPPAIGVLHAQRFELAQPARHWWRSGGPLYRSGWLLVLKVERDLVQPRQSLEPVLYVGGETAERVNIGNQSGAVVAIVPGNFFLVDAPIFFGAPALPEEISYRDVQSELARAERLGVRPAPDAEVGAVLAAPLQLADAAELRRKAIDLVARWSPQEQDLIRGERVPLVR